MAMEGRFVELMEGLPVVMRLAPCRQLTEDDSGLGNAASLFPDVLASRTQGGKKASKSA